MRARALCLVTTLLGASLVVPPPSAVAGAPTLSRQLRRNGRRLDKALIRIDRALLRLPQQNGRHRAMGSLRKAQRKLRRFLGDTDIRCAYVELTAAMSVLADPTFSPKLDTSPVEVHTETAVACITGSPVYADTHADGVYFLGLSADFGRRDTTRVFRPLGRTGPFDLLKIRASNSDLYVDRLRIFFAPGEPVDSQVHNHIDDLDRGRSKTFVLAGAFIDYVRVTAESEEEPDKKGRLKFWGIDLDP